MPLADEQGFHRANECPSGNLDAALLALEFEIFSDNQTLAENDEFLINILAHWNAEMRRDNLAELISGYGKPDIRTHIIHALARLICREVEWELNAILERAIHPPG